jgi:hypothetical protein
MYGSSLRMRENVSHPYKTTGTFTVFAPIF